MSRVLYAAVPGARTKCNPRTGVCCRLLVLLQQAD